MNYAIAFFFIASIVSGVKTLQWASIVGPLSAFERSSKNESLMRAAITPSEVSWWAFVISTAIWPMLIAYQLS